jgi:2-polyprenyl-3-methyl-5-hydroxy-6-metoxy-1,4-benzoquinol methylase
MIEVIEHIVQAEALVAELARVIRPGGWLIVTTPNVVHIAYRWRALTGHPPKQEGYHYRFFTRDTLAEIFAEAGFRLASQASFGKQALLSKLARLAGKGSKHKVRYVVPRPLETLFAQHFVWRLERVAK